MTAPQGPTELVELLPPPVSEYLGSWLADLAADGNSAAAANIAFTPPISGRQLRALYASLVI